MPTLKPRITITLKPETKAILDRLAEASGQPASSFIAEMVDEAAPTMFQPIIEALELAKDKKTEAWDVLNSMLSKSQYQAAQLTLNIHEEKRKSEEKQKKKRGKNATKA